MHNVGELESARTTWNYISCEFIDLYEGIFGSSGIFKYLTEIERSAICHGRTLDDRQRQKILFGLLRVNINAIICVSLDACINCFLYQDLRHPFSRQTNTSTSAMSTEHY